MKFIWASSKPAYERRWLAGAVLFAASLNACHAGDRDALRRIVQEQCAVNWVQRHSAEPCARIEVPAAPHERDGYALLADRKGGAHFLLIPTGTLAGMESVELLEPGAPNYFASAWRARGLIAAFLGHGVDRGAIGLAVNPRHARSQDQFHIHIECLRADIAETLRSADPPGTETWTRLALGAMPYLALRVMGEDLHADPIALLADRLPEAKRDLGDYTLVVAGMNFREGPGFMLLASQGPAGELLLDSTCALTALK
jgi:CDP-diacylglycerol pyrophosphatase